MPRVSGKRKRVKKIISRQKNVNIQKLMYAPRLSETMTKYLVMRNAKIQHTDVVTADPRALMFGGNISAITAQGSGPNPVTSAAIECWRIKGLLLLNIGVTLYKPLKRMSEQRCEADKAGFCLQLC